MERIVVWFSCGAASAVAAKLTVEKHGLSTHVIYCDTSKSEHPDNMRFLKDCEKWLGVEIRILPTVVFDSVDAVFDSDKASWMSGIRGAECTVRLKKIPRFNFQKPDDVHVFGYTADESKRRDSFEKNNPELKTEWPLIEQGFSKTACIEMLMRAGIKIPAMYQLGYKNNNCIGCVKATSPAYWNKIRADFPEVFAKRQAQSRRIGCRLTRVKDGGAWKRIYLDELRPDNTEEVDEDLSCGPQCGLVFAADVPPEISVTGK